MRIFKIIITGHLLLFILPIKAQNLYSKSIGSIEVKTPNSSESMVFTSSANNFSYISETKQLEVRVKLDTYLSDNTNLMQKLDAAGARLFEITIPSVELPERSSSLTKLGSPVNVKLLGKEQTETLHLYIIYQNENGSYRLEMLDDLKLEINVSKYQDGRDETLLIKFDSVELKPYPSAKP